MKRRPFLLAALAAPSLSPALAFAQGRPIRLIVPYAPGGPIDVTARLLAERVKDSLGTVIIENKPGGGGNIGADAVAKAAPDGLTIGIAAVATHAINPWLFAKMPYDASKDFAPVTQMVRVPNVLVMNAETAGRLKINTLSDLIAYGKSNPGRLNYGSGGNGSAGHLAGEMFKQGAGIFAVHIPYNGGNPAQLALLSGQVDFNFDNLATAAPNIRAGKLKALAVTTLNRSPALPDVPPVADTLKGFAIDTWWGLVGAAGHTQGRHCQTQQRLRSGSRVAGGQDTFCCIDGRTRDQQPRRVRRLHEGGTEQVRKTRAPFGRKSGLKN
jgi:tripartite-type tricarboxylate transporter receptor subunit TctC